MEISEILKNELSVYRTVKENKATGVTTIDRWIHDASSYAEPHIKKIRLANETDPKIAKELKVMNLPCVTMSATFDGERKADLVTRKNNVICIDIDDIPEGMTVDELKKMVFNLPYVFYVSLSARGEGIFALVCYDKNNDFKGTFLALEKEFSDMGIMIDKSCKDICRLRFASWDSNPLEKTGDVQMYCKTLKEPSLAETIKYDYPVSIDDYFLYKTIKYLISHCGYRADTYQDWLIEGFRLATFGQYGHPLFIYLSSVSQNYNPSYAERKWNECVRTTKMNKDCLMYYLAEAKRRIGVDWKEIIKKS